MTEFSSICAATIYYSFDSSTVSGSTLRNQGAGGSAYDAILHGSPAVDTVNKIVGTGAMYLVTASSQYIQIPPFTTGNTGQSFAFWFKFMGSMSVSGSGSRVFDFGNGGPADNIVFCLRLTYNYFEVYVANGAVPYAEFLSNDVNVNDGVWRHVVWTIDTSGNFLVYLNGVLHSSFPTVFYPRNILRTYNYLGKDNWGVNSYTNGALDEFYMFPTVLDVPQIQSLYLQGRKIKQIVRLKYHLLTFVILLLYFSIFSYFVPRYTSGSSNPFRFVILLRSFTYMQYN